MNGTASTVIDFAAFKKAAETLKGVSDSNTLDDPTQLRKVAEMLKPYCNADKRNDIDPVTFEIFKQAAMTVSNKFEDSRKLHHFLGNARGTAMKPLQYDTPRREPVYKFFAAVGSMR